MVVQGIDMMLKEPVKKNMLILFHQQKYLCNI